MDEAIRMMIIPVLVGVVEVVKKAGLDTRYVPALSLLLGAAVSVALEGITVPAVLQGLMYGLSACGLYSGTKATLE